MGIEIVALLQKLTLTLGQDALLSKLHGLLGVKAMQVNLNLLSCLEIGFLLFFKMILSL